MARRPRLMMLVLFVVAPALLLAGGPGALAQPRPEPMEDYAALGLGRIAMLDLRMRAEPTEADYRIAQLALDLARSFAPEEPILLRHQIEAAWSAGRDRDALALTRALVSLDPRDEVALLRVIAEGFEQIHTVEERLRAYERLLGAQGISPAVRSRLALDAALLAREAGDQERFVELLATATELDSTNKAAAALALAFFSAASDDAVGRLELLANLLLADPVDPNVHQQIADLLAQGGAFEQALRFHDHAQQLMAAGRFAPEEAMALRRVRLRWLAEGPQGLADELELPVLQERARLEQMLKLMRQRGESTEGMQQPGQLLPGPQSALLRMLVAEAAGDPTAASRASEDLRQATAERMSQALVDTQGNRDRAREVALLATRIRAETATAMILAGVQTELVRQDLQKATEDLTEALAQERLLGEFDPQKVAPVRTQLNLAVELVNAIDAAGTPQAEERLGVLEARMQRDRVPMAPMAYVHALIANGRTSEALPLLREIARADPASLWGAWAVQELRDLNVRPPFPQAEVLGSTARAIPGWLDRMVQGPEQFMELTVEAPSREEHVTSITRLRLTLRNNAPIPLAVGPNAPINSRMMLSPVLDADLDRLTPIAIPEVASVDTRLRLMPRERLVMDVWAGGGLAGWYLEAAGTRTTRTRWRALQGFIATQSSGYLPGPMCLSAETRLITRRPLPEARFDFDRLGDRFEGDDPAVLATLGALVKSVLIGPGTPRGGRDPEPFADVMDRAGQRFSQACELAQVTMLVALPNTRMAQAMTPFDRMALDAARPPVALAAALLTRAVDPAHPAFDRAAASDDPRLVELAGLLRDRLEEGASTYANYSGFGPQQRPAASPPPPPSP